jgi:ribosome-associated toxin RatA of RatAB toxin-antitoxin module
VRFEESIVVGASVEQVYARAADLEAYSDLADEYRQSRVLSRGEGEAVVERKARIGGIPFTWRSRAAFSPPERIEFRQISGPLRGMRTAWHIAPEPDGTRLRIVHDLAPAPGPVGDLLARAVYRLFIKSLALKILRNLKAAVEQQQPQQ